MHKYDLILLYLSAYIMPMHSILATDGLVNHDLAERLRSELINGSLLPGVRMIERKWALKFGVAQCSIREAINILAQDGFVTKESGRSARVIHLSEEDVAKLYELWGAIEGLAARLAAAAQPDLTALRASDGGGHAAVGNRGKLRWPARQRSAISSRALQDLCEHLPSWTTPAGFNCLVCICADASGRKRAGNVGLGQRLGSASTDYPSAPRGRG